MSSQRLSRRKRVMFAACGVLLGLLAVEVLLRLGYAVVERGRPAGPTPVEEQPYYAAQPWGRTYWRELGSAKIRPWPYLDTMSPRYASAMINHYPPERRTSNVGVPADAPEVWFFGGSTVLGGGARDEHTIPSEVSRLATAAGRPLRCRNFGQLGWVSTQEVLLLNQLLRSGRRPAMVVMYDGWNDLQAASNQGFEPGPPFSAHGARVRLDGHPLHSQLTLSRYALPSHLAAARLALDLRGAAARRGRDEAADVADPAALTAAAERIVEPYLANLRWVRRLGQRYGFATRFAWQPIADPRPWRAAPHAATVAPVYHRATALLREAAEPGWSDLTEVFDASSEPQFFDGCHVFEPHNAILAAALLEVMAE